MRTKFIEAYGNDLNWGKFCIAEYDDEEWNRPSQMPGESFGRPLIGQLGWDRRKPKHIWVMDMQTGEAAYFQHGGSAHYDLNGGKHQIWVCPLFEPFLVWLYQQDVSDIEALPDTVELPNAPASLAGYRRSRY